MSNLGTQQITSNLKLKHIPGSRIEQMQTLTHERLFMHFFPLELEEMTNKTFRFDLKRQVFVSFILIYVTSFNIWLSNGLKLPMRKEVLFHSDEE